MDELLMAMNTDVTPIQPKRLPLALYLVAALLLCVGTLLAVNWAGYPMSGPDFDLVGAFLCVAGAVGLIARNRIGYVFAICAVLGLGAALATTAIPDFIDQLFNIAWIPYREFLWLVAVLLALGAYVAWREPGMRRRVVQFRAIRFVAAVLLWAGGVTILMLVLLGVNPGGSQYQVMFTPMVVVRLMGPDYNQYLFFAWTALGAAFVACTALSAQTLFSDNIQAIFDDYGGVRPLPDARALSSNLKSILTSESAGRVAAMLMPLTLVFLVEFIWRDVGQYPCTTCGWPPDWLPYILGIAFHAAFLAIVATFVWLNRRTVARLAISGSWSDLVLCSSGWSSFTVLLNLAIADVPIVVRDSNSDFAIAAFVLEVALFVGTVTLIAFRRAPFWTAIPLLIGVPDLLFVANAISSGWYVGLNPHRGSLCLFSFAYIHASHTAAVGLALQLIVIVFVALRTRANWILISVGCALAVMMATSLLIVGHGAAFDWMDVSCSSRAPGITSWMNYVWP